MSLLGGRDLITINANSTFLILLQYVENIFIFKDTCVMAYFYRIIGLQVIPKAHFLFLFVVKYLNHLL